MLPSIVLWLFLATPKKECVEKVKHANLGECHPVENYTQSVCHDGDLTFPCSFPAPSATPPDMLCKQVSNPQPLPEEKTLLSTDRYALKSDDCYDVWKTSVTLSSDESDQGFTINGATVAFGVVNLEGITPSGTTTTRGEK